MQSMVKDIIRKGVSEKAEATCEVIANACKNKVSDENATNVFESLRRKGVFSKDLQAMASALYNNVHEITILPEEKSTWRLSNVLSCMAKGDNLVADKRLELEDEAYTILTNN